MLIHQGVNKRGETIATSGSGGSSSGSHHAAVHSILQGRRTASSRSKSPFGSLLGRSYSPSAHGRYSAPSISDFLVDQAAFEEAARAVGDSRMSRRRSADAIMAKTATAQRDVPLAEGGEDRGRKLSTVAEAPEDVPDRERERSLSRKTLSRRGRSVEGREDQGRRPSAAPAEPPRERKRSLSRKVLSRRGRSEGPRGSRYDEPDESQQQRRLPPQPPVVGRSLSADPIILRHEDGDPNGNDAAPPEPSENSPPISLVTPIPKDILPGKESDVSSVSLLSYAGRPDESPQARPKTRSKSKKLWNVVRRGWRRNKGASAKKGGGRDSNKSPPSRHIIDDSLKEEDVPPLFMDDEDDDDVPWAPTMTMLVKTGQLDRIDSESDEDGEEEISVNIGSDNMDNGEGEARRGDVFGSSNRHLGEEDAGSVDSRGGSINSGHDGKGKVTKLESRAHVYNLSGSDRSSSVGGDSRSSSQVSRGGSFTSSYDGQGRVSMVDSGRKVTKENSGGHFFNLSDSDRSRTLSIASIGGERSLASMASINSRVSKASGVGPMDFGADATRRASLNAPNSSEGEPPGGHHLEDIMEMSGNQDSMNKFFDEVARRYMETQAEGGVQSMEVVLHDDASRADESTLTKDDTVYSHQVRKKMSDRKSFLGLMRGRSRGRKKAAMALDKIDSDDGSVVSEASDSDPPRNIASDSNMQNTATRGRELTPHRRNKSRSRSRSLLRILPMLKSANKIPEPIEEEDPAEPQRRGRGSSLEPRGNYETPNGPRARRDTKSLPRMASQTPDTHGPSLDDSRASLEDSRPSLEESHGSSFDHSNATLQRKRSRRKRCLVCQRKIPRGEGIHRMDFHFCSGECFRCTSCGKGLSEEEEDDDEEGLGGFQIISNARGSILQCGECAKSIIGGTPARPTMLSPDEADETVEMGSTRGSIHLDSSNDEADAGADGAEVGTARQPSPASGDNGGHADRLSRAVRRLPEKASVTLGLVASSGRSSENERLTSLTFMQSEEDNHSLKKHLSSSEVNVSDDANIVYELDSDAVGNPNYDGYACSFTNIDEAHDGPLRMTSLSMPKLESDEMDGAISEQLKIDFHWADDDENSYVSSSSENGGIWPEPTGPAMLSIELFQSATIKETVMKTLRRTWEYRENHIVYKFAFVVPFKKIYISWEIDEGDELDLTQAQLEVTVRYEPPLPPRPRKETRQEPGLGESGFGTSAAVPASTVHGGKMNGTDASSSSSSEESMPNAVYVKTISIDSPGAAAGAPSSHILRKGGALDPDRDENDNFSELLSAASCVNSTIALPAIMYVRVDKPEYETEVGLSLIEKNSATVVAEVSKSGLFANSQIKEGCEILAINGQCVHGPRSVMRIMKDIFGKVFIMATGSPSPPGARFVVKKHNTTGFGRRNLQEDITFKSVNGLVRVQDVAENGMFAGSAISKGDICLSVDGVPAVGEDVANRALARSQGIVAMLIFSLPSFWKSIVEFIIDEKYARWWKKDSECALLWGNEDCAPVKLLFDESSGLCKADGNEENEVDLSYMNIILERVMKLLTGSIRAYRTESKERVRSSSRSLSVSASGKMKNRSDVYRRALIKLDQMRENGMLTAEDYEAGRHALAHVAIQTVT